MLKTDPKVTTQNNGKINPRMKNNNAVASA